MRVTHVITRLVVGGAQENTAATVLGLRDNPEFIVDLISGPTFGPEGSLAADLQKIPGLLTVLPDLVRPVHPLKDLAALRKLARRFRAARPDIVHTHSGKAGILGRLAAARAGVPIIIHTIHGPSFGAFQGMMANFVFTAAERKAGSVTTHFMSVADAMTRQYLAAGIGIPAQYTTIYSGFPLEPYLSAENDPAFRHRLGLSKDDLVIGQISRLFKLKGHDDLLAVASAVIRQCPQARFLIVGDGAWRSRLERRVEKMGLQPSFLFTGLVPAAEIPRYLGVMDILVHLSRREGLPRALPQALAAGRPVIAYDCDGAREVCRPGETGFLIAPGDLTGLEQRILQLAGDAALRGQLGARGREFVRERFSVATMVEKTASLYRTLANKPLA